MTERTELVNAVANLGPFPVTRGQVIDRVRLNKAPSVIMDIFTHLPEKTWDNVDAVVTEAYAFVTDRHM